MKCSFCFASQSSVWRKASDLDKVLCQDCFIGWSRRTKRPKLIDSINEEGKRLHSYYCKACNIAWNSDIKKSMENYSINFKNQPNSGKIGYGLK